MTDQPTTEEQVLKPTLGEDVTELFSRVAKLNDQMAAVLAPEWGARMGILPEGHPLHPEPPEADPEEQEQAASADWEAVARRRERELKQVGEARHRAEEELRRYTENESADAAAGSYAGRAERVEAQLTAVADLIADHEGDEWAAHPATTALRGILDSEEHVIAQPSTAQANLLVTVTAPNPANAVRWAGHVRDLVHAEFGGSMGLHSVIELEPGGTIEPHLTGPLTGIEIRDPCPWCESSPALIPRVLMDEHVTTVHPEVRTGAPAIPVPDAEPVIVCTTACDEQHTYGWTCEQFAGIAPEPEAAVEESRAEATDARVTALYEQWVKAGAPPLGVPTARWWDQRLVELRGAINVSAEEAP